ncbi:response regulator [uncultured Thiocystis sp.]|uniref:response regulator transcription factor n=1 Tax=uncultured Thiocystis sp. TaxID=1202134 RepID=UPI0025DE94BE|nr:response regulator [uncultured Thiocystis sp.]
MLEIAKKVLLIDDDPHQLFAASLIVKRFGFAVVTAGDGASGLELARTERPDIIVCDIMMPGQNGFMLKSLLAKDPLTAEIPFIFLTARTLQADKLAALEHGVDDYLTKPFHPEELIGRIRAVLRRYDAGRRQGRTEAP